MKQGYFGFNGLKISPERFDEMKEVVRDMYVALMSLGWGEITDNLEKKELFSNLEEKVGGFSSSEKEYADALIELLQEAVLSAREWEEQNEKNRYAVPPIFLRI